MTVMCGRMDKSEMIMIKFSLVYNLTRFFTISVKRVQPNRKSEQPTEKVSHTSANSRKTESRALEWQQRLCNIQQNPHHTHILYPLNYKTMLSYYIKSTLTSWNIIHLKLTFIQI